METAAQINYLLGKLDATVATLTDAAHPDVYLRLDINCLLPGAEGLTTCAVTHPPETDADLTLVPLQAHCAGCGVLFPLAPHSTDIHCPACAVPPGTV